jgi:hypothetical protein
MGYHCQTQRSGCGVVSWGPLRQAQGPTLYYFQPVHEPVEGPVPHIEMLSKTNKINFMVQSPASDNSARLSG